MVDITDPACEVAHGAPAPVRVRTLVAVFASPVARYLLRYGRDLGYTTVLVEPDVAGAAADDRAVADAVRAGVDHLDDTADVVVTDHDRAELGEVLRDVLRRPVRWVGVMGSVRHTPPHVGARRALGVADADIARVHRPIGLNIGSQTPAEIALATVAGLVADRNKRPGGFTF